MVEIILSHLIFLIKLIFQKFGHIWIQNILKVVQLKIHSN